MFAFQLYISALQRFVSYIYIQNGKGEEIHNLDMNYPKQMSTIRFDLHYLKFHL